MRTARLPLALAVAQCAQLLPWRDLTSDTGALPLAALAIVLAGALGSGGRALRWHPVVIAAVQTAGLVGLTWAGIAAHHGAADAAQGLRLLPAGVSVILSSGVPMPPHPGVAAIIALTAGLLAIVTDALAVSGGRPALGVVPLVALHLVTAFGLAGATLFSDLVLLAAGTGLVLWSGRRQTGREGGPTRAVGALAAAIMTAGALGTTWLVAPLLPTFEPRPTSEPLQMNDPSVDLKRNLIQGSDDVVIRYTTDNGEGTYLKLASLPSLTTRGFGLAEVRVATGRMPNPPGSPAGEARTTSVSIGEFRSEWLPVPAVPTAFEAPGEWGFAIDTLDVMALAGPARGSATEGIEYEVRSLEVRPSAAVIAGASANAAPHRDLTLAVPDEVTDRTRALAHEITAGASTAGARAQAIEAYLRSPRFTYSTAATTGIGDGLATIDEFLFRSREGYCEQFAGAMAILAREAGIPSRLAVGFVPGRRDGDGWSVTAREMHTWPELWLDGLGWVAFEPTPGRGPTGEAGGTGEPSPAPADEQPAETARPDDEAATPTPEAQAPAGETPTPPPAASPLPWVIAAIALAVLLAGAAVLAPRWTRAYRRARRLAGAGDPRLDTLAAWDEVRIAAARAGVAWPGSSPRFVAERLRETVGDDPDAAAALEALAISAERALFDRPENYAGAGDWRAEVSTIVTALARPRPTG